MSAFVAFLQSLLADGAVTFTQRPSTADRKAARTVLEGAYGNYRLDVAGPLIAARPVQMRSR